MKFEIINTNVEEVKTSYIFNLDESTRIDPEYAKRVGSNRVGDKIDELYDGFVDLAQGDDGRLYGVIRDFNAPDYPVVIWHEMRAKA